MLFLIINLSFLFPSKNRESWISSNIHGKGHRPGMQGMIALHFRDSPQDILLRPSILPSGRQNTSAACPFPLPECLFPMAMGTDARRTSIDSLFIEF